MMGAAKHEARAVFTAALALRTPDERAHYLDEACQGKPDLRQRVEALLRAHEQASHFLELNDPEPDVLREGPGTVIGRYKLLEEIGEGAFGRVFMAEQTEPVCRKVALKIIKAGMDTREVVARFEAERQALALMDHPNIAKVLDAGATETGRPYFVMELVRGIPITGHCEQHQLSTAERLQLFMKVCHAVQHAHQKGIIHRDLKPTNILVTVIDGEAVPKVIDFGVAKALGQKLTEKTVFTRFQQMVGTPAYMSPEQAALSGVDVDTRSDIYSLGVLLYELLTGVTPFDQGAFRKAALDEICRFIRETEPPKPSTRLHALIAADVRRLKSKSDIRSPKSETDGASSCRLLRIRETIRLIRGDLDWIVMKCLEKDRARRYETANALARDVEHHLDQEPVSAAAPSTLYRFRKFVRRNRLAVAATVAVFLALALGTGATTWLYLREREALREQIRLRLEAGKARAAETNARTELQVRRDIARARTLVDEEKYSEAEEMLNNIEPASLAGDSIVRETRLALAWQAIAKSDWNESVNRMALLIRDAGSAWNFDVASDYGRYATILVQTGRAAEYENFRRSMLTRFATDNDPGLSRYLCRIAMYAPADEGIRKGIAIHYDSAIKSARLFEGRNQINESESLFSIALTEYRLGDFPRAAQRSDRALSLPFSYPLYIPKVIALRAMALHQLKEGDDARLTLAFCHQQVDPVMGAGPSTFGLNTIGGWTGWVEDANLQREADALIGTPLADDYARLAEARSKLNEAEKFGTNPDFYGAARTEHDRAQQLGAETPPILQRTGGKKFVSLLRALGLWELQHRDWRAALTNWNLVVYGPSSRGSLLYGQELSSFCLSFAPLLVELDDREGYEKFRTNAIATFGGTAIPANAARILETCLLRPTDEKQMLALKELAAVLTGQPASSNGLPAGDFTLALFKYRSGDPSGALESVRTNLNLAVTTPALAARAGVLTAMCMARLGRVNEAQAEMDALRETIGNKFNSPPISQPSDLETWHDWWVNHILLQEAQALLQQ
jgi:eukaryotic-like serine/threonine-protein kinase